MAPVGVEEATRNATAQVDDGSAVLTLASGNLGLVYLTDVPGRASLEQIQARYPRLLKGLLDHPGIGFVLARSAGGPLALGPRGAYHLDDETVEGEDPLAPFGPLAAVRLRRTDGFAHCADLMINSSYEPQTDQVESFESFVGSHGGMGGPQTEAFVLYPADLEMPADSIMGAEALHLVFRGWLAKLGHTGFADPTTWGE